MVMANIIDYLKWRGDITLRQDPLNKVDAMLFACISYVDFGGVVPEDDVEISFADACSRFFELHSEEELAADNSFISFAPSLFKEAAACARYRDLTMSRYVNHIDINDMIQFSAVTIRLSEDEVFIAFRGTDDTIVGWKEDFYISCTTISSEDESIVYLTEGQKGRCDRIYLGGHSKGGHLAIYSAYNADSDIRNRVARIYDFDGPGFNSEVMATEPFRSVGPRITRVIPENSIIGRLLSDTAEPLIVLSTEKGIMQHDPMSWQIEGKLFLAVEKNSVASDVFDETLTKWIDELDTDEKKRFIDDLFAVLEASGETNVSKLSGLSLQAVKAMLGKMQLLRKGSRDKIRLLLKYFLGNWGEVIAHTSKFMSVREKFPLKRLISSKRRLTEEGES